MTLTSPARIAFRLHNGSGKRLFKGTLQKLAKRPPHLGQAKTLRDRSPTLGRLATSNEGRGTGILRSQAARVSISSASHVPLREKALVGTDNACFYAKE